MAHRGSRGEWSTHFLPLLKFSNLCKLSEVWEEHWDTPFQQGMMGWIHCTNFLANFLQIFTCKCKYLSAFVWVKPYCTMPPLKVSYWSKLYIDFSPHKTTTMKAHVSCQPLVRSIQSQWDDYHCSLSHGTCQHVFASRNWNISLVHSSFFREGIGSHVFLIRLSGKLQQVVYSLRVSHAASPRSLSPLRTKFCY